MNDKQIFRRIIAGIIAAFLGSLIVIPIQLLYSATGRRIDSGDDGWGALGVLLTALSGIAGFIFSAKWARKRYADFQA